MNKIDNETFKQVVTEVACQITTERFGENTWIAKQDDQSVLEYFEYSPEAQEYFNNKYDEIEHLLITDLNLKIKPKPGEYYVFPPEIYHGFDKSIEEDNRYSLVFNINVNDNLFKYLKKKNKI